MTVIELAVSQCKKFDDNFSRFDAMPSCDGETDRRMG